MAFLRPVASKCKLVTQSCHGQFSARPVAIANSRSYQKRYFATENGEETRDGKPEHEKSKSAFFKWTIGASVIGGAVYYWYTTKSIEELTSASDFVTIGSWKLEHAAGFKGKKIEKVHSSTNSDSFEQLSGQDAFFIAPLQPSKDKSGGIAAGVADGVGGWSKRGVDSGIIARKIMSNCKFAVESNVTNPLDILRFAHTKMVTNKEVEAGGTTACLVTLTAKPNGSNALLSWTNLGDSGLIVLRQEKVAFRSPIQNYKNGAPFALSVIPPHLSHLRLVHCKPDEAASGTFPIQSGDVILLGSDGVWDNLNEHEIVDIAKENKVHTNGNLKENLSSDSKKLRSVEDLSKIFVQKAWDAKRKPDDTTVVVLRASKM